jgi:hypothetical protein
MGLFDWLPWQKSEVLRPPEGETEGAAAPEDLGGEPGSPEDALAASHGRQARVERLVGLLEGGHLSRAGKLVQLDEWGKDGLKAAFGDLPRILDSVPEAELRTVRVAGALMFLLGLRHPPASFGRPLVGPRFDFEAASRMVLSFCLLTREVAASRDLGFKRATVYGRDQCCPECRAIPKVIAVDDALKLLLKSCSNGEGCGCWISPELD